MLVVNLCSLVLLPFSFLIFSVSAKVFQVQKFFRRDISVFAKFSMRLLALLLKSSLSQKVCLILLDSWMRSSLVIRASTANAEVATVLGSIRASSDTVKSEGRQMKQCWIQFIEKKNKKIPLLKNSYNYSCGLCENDESFPFHPIFNYFIHF